MPTKSETEITALLPTKSLITLKINGVEKKIELAPWTTLLDALREYLDLTGTKKVAITDSVEPVLF